MGVTCLCFRNSCFVSGRKGRVRKYVLFWGCFTNYFFWLLVRRDCGRKMFYFVHCNISQECTHRAVEVQVFVKNDLPTESLLSAPYVNVFCFLIFFPWWSAVPAFEQQEPATRGFISVLTGFALLSCYNRDFFSR